MHCLFFYGKEHSLKYIPWQKSVTQREKRAAAILSATVLSQNKHYYYKMKRVKSKQYDCSFIESYAKCITESHKGEHFAHCIICNSYIKILHRGRGVIKDHSDTTKHSDNLSIRNHIIFLLLHV